MKKKLLFCLSCMLIAVMMMLTACSEVQNEGVVPTKNFGKKSFLAEKTVGTNTVKIYADDEIDDAYKTVTFEETNNLCADNDGQGWVALEEPLIGGLPSLGYEGNLPEVKVVSLSTGWSCFEETPGVYDWRVMDETIEYWVNHGKMINMRLCTDNLDLNQGVVNGCPEWLFHEPYNVPKIIKEGQIYADLSSKVYLEQLRKFLAEFAGHYASEDYPYRDAIEVVELRGYGMVGEWHSGWNTYTSVEERTQALCNIIDMWREAWGDTLLVLSCTYEFLNNMPGVINAENYSDFMYWMGYDHALTLDNITFRRDGIAFSLWPYDARFATDYYYMNTDLPLLGEIGDGYHKHTDDDPYPVFEAVNEALHKWRVNYNTVIGWVAQDFNNVLKKETPITDYMVRMMGYRLVPDKVQYSAKAKAGDKIYLNTLWTNQAMGRMWKDHDLSIYLEDKTGKIVYTGTDKSFDPVSINGGEPHFFDLEYQLPATLEKGTYTLKMAISDANGNPAVEMPIAGNDGTNRYYVGEVVIGDEAAKDLTKVDAMDENSSFTAINGGKLTNRLVNVDGTKALVGSGSGAFAYGQKLENGKTYYISFEYKTDKDKNDISITDASRYMVGAYEKRGDAWGDKYEWLDVSNNVSHRSVTVKVPDDGKTYYAAFGCKNSAAEIAIDNVSVVEADVQNASFRINPNFTENKGDGEYVIKSNLTQNWADGLQLKERLDAHATYMITFDAATVQDVSNGGFFYVTLVDPTANVYDKKAYVDSYSMNRIGSWWTPIDYGHKKYSYVFNTGDYGDGWQLVFGIRNMGSVSIKNITMTRIDSDYAYTSDAEVIKRNVIPEKNIDVDKNGVVENFEAGVFNGGCMYPGTFSTGIINRKYVISGNYSCYVCNFNPNHRGYEFNNFVQTNLDDMRFTANTTYRVRFKFMIIEPLNKEENGYFYCFAREDGTFLHDVGAFEWKGDGLEVGEVYSVEYEFTTGNADNYFFIWGVSKYGALAIDDVTFDKVDNPTGQKPTVTKGHAYQITQEVLYKREGE